MRQDEIAWDQAQTEGNEILAEYPTQNLDRRERECYNATREMVVEEAFDFALNETNVPIYMSISANRPPKYEATMPTTDEVSYAIPEIEAFELGLST